jgi:hypothetical protein
MIEQKKSIFIPSQQDKDDAREACYEIIDLLAKYKSLAKKAYILHMLIDSFQDLSGYNLREARTIGEK